ncbi:class I SAM-dependent methyltransferase [Nocardioides marmoribigeumensis]|uniref:SAM-dependent methyltransferase n=1 Tax=Nocardioides marmoribigeumensis TaxID=433649 RepID=A0ABU2BZE1_9ACTN|nr:class I SAM-dependent methyltransferase [Nocardioides marmoribigeumensis]MDR7363780.1 SAM-dependent methyltransferase [Nocardioides marmoribigeumensis]
MDEQTRALADYFDRWYADLRAPGPGDLRTAAVDKDEVHRRHLGLPERLPSNSLLTWDGVAEVHGLLRLPAGGHLVDLACGRGGYGLELATRAAARLTGVDFSDEALRQAREVARGWACEATFATGELAATGLPDAGADAVVYIDAIQFAADPAAAYAELRRVLRPGGRVVLTCWEPVDRGDVLLPERLRSVDLAGGLARAGFEDVVVIERPDWRRQERGMWEEAAALDPGDDPALRSFHDEGVRSLERWDAVRRVLASASAPRA